jgi:hypothetical protein
MVKPTAEVVDVEFEEVDLLEDLAVNISPNQIMDIIVFWCSPSAKSLISLPPPKKKVPQSMG